MTRASLVDRSVGSVHTGFGLCAGPVALIANACCFAHLPPVAPPAAFGEIIGEGSDGSRLCENVFSHDLGRFGPFTEPSANIMAGVCAQRAAGVDVLAHSRQPEWRLRMIAIHPSRCSAGASITPAPGRTFAVELLPGRSGLASRAVVRRTRSQGTVRTVRVRAAPALQRDPETVKVRPKQILIAKWIANLKTN
jgi:hypothetical protein